MDGADVEIDVDLDVVGVGYPVVPLMGARTFCCGAESAYIQRVQLMS